MHQVFSPSWGRTVAITNATSATAAVVLPYDADEIVVTNTSPTASVSVTVTYFENEATPPVGIAPTLTTGLPVLPSGQVRVFVGPGNKVIRTIASAVDGSVIITPGRGI